jgi:hypothetical protein
MKNYNVPVGTAFRGRNQKQLLTVAQISRFAACERAAIGRNRPAFEVELRHGLVMAIPTAPAKVEETESELIRSPCGRTVEGV